MIIHWHPDGLIYLRNDDWTVFYCGTVAEAASVLGEPIDPLPAGVKERQMKVDEWCRDFLTNGDQVATPGAWSVAEKIKSKAGVFSGDYEKKVERNSKAANAAFVNAKEQAEGKQDAINEKPKPMKPI